MSFRPAIFAAALAVGALVAVPSARGNETWTVGGKTFERVRVLEVTDGAVMIAHAGGMVQLELAVLPPELQQRFNYDPTRADAWKRDAESGMAATVEMQRQLAAEQHRRVQIQALKDRIAQRAAAADTSRVELLPEVDLRPIFAEHSLYLKSQGARPSCSIFAVVGVLEYEYARRFGTAEQLSEEFLIWAYQHKYPGKPINDGYHFDEVFDVLRTYGIARRALLPDTFASYLRDEEPPAAALEDARTRRGFTVLGVRPSDEQLLAKLAMVLNQRTPVIIGIRWPAPSTLERNNLLKDQTPQRAAGHAVTLVGYRSDGTPESLVFIYRNSYGPQWGLGGYGLMAGSYLQKHVLSAFCLVVTPPEQES